MTSPHVPCSVSWILQLLYTLLSGLPASSLSLCRFMVHSCPSGVVHLVCSLCVPTSCFSSNIQVNGAPGKQHALGLSMLAGNILPSQSFLHVAVSCLFWRYSLEPSPVQCLHWITSSNPHLQLGASSLCSFDTRRTATDEALLLL